MGLVFAENSSEIVGWVLFVDVGGAWSVGRLRLFPEPVEDTAGASCELWPVFCLLCIEATEGWRGRDVDVFELSDYLL